MKGRFREAKPYAVSRGGKKQKGGPRSRGRPFRFVQALSYSAGWIDRINMSVFGKTEFYEEPGPSVDYGEIENVHDVENITMMLS